jgi:4-hydroxythreonine-4-phosphate dehydrogenase
MELADRPKQRIGSSQRHTLDKKCASPEFIFMLTRNDVTVPDAVECVKEVLHPEVRIIGFKDIGLDIGALTELASVIRASGREIALEVVSLDETAELRSAELAMRLEVDCLLGGTRAEAVTKLLDGTSLRYYPFPQGVRGHPSQLHGTIEDIVESGRRLAEMPGVTGIDLLAYRFSGRAESLLNAFTAAISAPVIAAGSIDRRERIEAVKAAGVWAFTVGSAAFERCFAPAASDLCAQIRAIVAMRDGQA